MKAAKLLALVQKKRGFFEALLDLTETELTLPLNRWIAVLEQKKVLLSCIEEIDERLTPFKDSLQSLSQEIADELDHIHKLVERIINLDANNRKARKQDFGSSLP